MSDIIRAGFIGYGYVGQSHYDAIKNMPNVKLTALAGGRNVEKGKRTAAEWGARYCTVEEVCTAPDVDAVWIMSPCASHLPQLRMALQNGKHVLLEKPLAMSLAETVEMYKLAQEAKERGILCFPGHSYLYMPDLTRMKKLNDEGAFGKPSFFYMRETSFSPDDVRERYIGPMHENFCHQFYLMMAYLGIPRSVAAFAGSFKPVPPNWAWDAEHVIANFRFANGAAAMLANGWCSEDVTTTPWRFKVKLLGTKGCAQYGKDEVGNFHIPPAFSNVRVVYPNYLLYDESFVAENDYFINRCLLGGEEPLSDMGIGVMCAHILEAIERSLYSHTVEPILPLEELLEDPPPRVKV